MFRALQDILENEDVKLDNMFVASLVADIIRVRTCRYKPFNIIVSVRL
jgi:hypothetical protein